MRLASKFLLLIFLLPSGSFAGSCAETYVSTLNILLDSQPVSSPKELADRIQRVKERAIPNDGYAQAHPEKGFVEVVKVGKLKHSFLAIFNHSYYMNLALGRIVMFQTQGRILSDAQMLAKNSPSQQFGGHDLSASLIRDYLKAFPPENLSSTPRLKVEKEFWEEIMLPHLKDDSQFVLIAAAMNYRTGKTISHENIHAHFYESLPLQKAVAQFWEDKVAATDKRKILNLLGDSHYDINNYDQVINEFLAYTLEEGRAQIFPAKLVQTYQKLLTDFLKAKGFSIAPIVDMNDFKDS